MGWGGMLTFMLCSWCYVDHGVGWDVNVHVMLMMLRWSWGGVGCSCYAHDVTLIKGWGGVGWEVNVNVMLMTLRWSWGGVGWDVNVHVALMMLRSEKKKSCRFWNNRPTGRYSNKCCLFIYFNTDILGLLAQKPSTTRIMGGDPKFKASFSCQLQKAYCYLCWWCLCMVQSCEGFESSLFSRESSAERICFHNSYSDQRIVEHQWNTDHWFRLEIVEMLASQGSSKKKTKKKRHWWLGDPLLKIGAKGLAMDVAQNKAARQ